MHEAISIFVALCCVLCVTSFCAAPVTREQETWHMAVVDRIEGNTVVLLVEGCGEVLLPWDLLSNCREGACYELKLRRRDDVRAEREAGIRQLQHALLEESRERCRDWRGTTDLQAAAGKKRNGCGAQDMNEL